MTHSSARGDRAPVLICFSHLRWNFVFQRPQHLMTRWARHAPVIYWEEPVEGPAGSIPRLDQRPLQCGVTVATPVLPADIAPRAVTPCLRRLLNGLVDSAPGLPGRASLPVLWYYTPMMLAFSGLLRSSCIVYDCMDELSGFAFAPPELPGLEHRLLAEADLVFTGGWSLYEAKRHLHPGVHALPSSVDAAHFARARLSACEPHDQARLPGPRLGFYGVIDERMDLPLVAALADARPDCTLVMIGPVAKIDPASLPQRPNIAWLGTKDYAQLPDYVAGWDVALMPFAINAATRFISPTKTPEYLAAGLPVVSTKVTDVARQYAGLAAVRIASDPATFIAACATALALRHSPDRAWLAEADALMADSSWDLVHDRMHNHVIAASRRPMRRFAAAAE